MLSNNTDLYQILGFQLFLLLDYCICNYLFVFNQAYNRVDVYDVYKIDPKTTNVEVELYGSWAAGPGLVVETENIWERRSNMKGHHIR